MSDHPHEEAPIAVKIRSLTKAFGETRAVDGVDLEVPEGSIYGFSAPTAPERPRPCG